MTMEAFANALGAELASQNQLTENGAAGYVSSGEKLLDFNFRVSSYRNCRESKIRADFQAVWEESPLLALKMLFFAGDVRRGLGERRLFRVCLQWLAEEHPDALRQVVGLIPEYHRWDAVAELCAVEAVADAALSEIRHQLEVDRRRLQAGKPVSLLAKWLPSSNASSSATRALAGRIWRGLGLTERAYRKALVELRAYLQVVEVKMTASEWGSIDYGAVPSKANLLYREAFLRHDMERRKAFLESVKKGERQIHSGVAFPYDIVHQYMDAERCLTDNLRPQVDLTLEEMWKALPDYVRGRGADTLCVVDGSGSMGTFVGNGGVTCHDVARSLAIYFSERMAGAFHGQFITFSEKPQLVSLNGCTTLRQKLETCIAHDECANTNIERTFDLILQTARKRHLPQSELPGSILVLSDMEFDAATVGGADEALFEGLRRRYEEHGYRLPRLVFWNIASRTMTVPLRQNAAGLALVSGFSPSTAEMVFSQELDPLKELLKALGSPRYLPVEEAFAAKA